MKTKLIRILFPVILFSLVMIFWSILYMRSIQVFPGYTGEMNALKTLNWGNMWKNVLLSTSKYWYYRISPTALFPLSLVDRDLIAPAMGIHFPSIMFKNASRLVYEGFFGAGFMSLAVYFLSVTLGFTHFESFLAGLYVGVFKGISYFFLFASTIHVIPLLVIYSTMTILFFVKYLQVRKKKLLIGYYLFLLLAVGAWEQWINLLAFILIFSIFFMITTRKTISSIVINGLIIPLVIFAGYIIVKYPAMKLEASNQGQEAEYVFSYPYKMLMAEDMISNASLHVADAVESALFPWPMLSQTVLNGIDPNAINSYNKVSNNDQWSQSHYLAFSDWYAGLLFGLTFVFSIWLGAYIFRNPEEIYKAGTGLVLLWTGFIAHLPIMYRGMFIKPGWEGLLGYKHMLSVVGVALIIAWLFGKLDAWLKKKLLLPPSNSQKKYSLAFFTFFTTICIFLVFNNTVKIAVSWYLRSRGMPW